VGRAREALGSGGRTQGCAEKGIWREEEKGIQNLIYLLIFIVNLVFLFTASSHA
jgi:hypothetical protein